MMVIRVRTDYSEEKISEGNHGFASRDSSKNEKKKVELLFIVHKMI